MTPAITKGQLARLQVLYSQLCAHTAQENTREARIGWAQALVQRSIASFKDLSADDARHLIDTLQGQLGIPSGQVSRWGSGRPRRRRLGREAAYKAGTEGRRGYESNAVTLATAEDLARVQYVRELIGWNQAQLDGWLRSPRSPLKKSNGEIRTLHDANRVYWALKGMAVRAGKWRQA